MRTEADRQPNSTSKPQIPTDLLKIQWVAQAARRGQSLPSLVPLCLGGSIPIQMSKSGIRNPLCLDPMLLWGSLDA
jgi:hypothetical protein